MRIQWGHMGILCLLLCTGCRKDLCYDHDQHGTSVKVDAQFSWEQEWERPYDHMEKPLNFAPFGHAELSLLAKI